MTDLEHEQRALRQKLAYLTSEATKNQEKHKRFQQIELKLLNSANLPQLLSCLVTETAACLKVDVVNLVLADSMQEIRTLLTTRGVSPRQFEGIVFVEDIQIFSPLYHNLNNPCLGPYQAAQHLALFPRQPRLRSVAILPLVQQGLVIGSLNFGSVDNTRYTRHHATDFLEHLAVIASVCLENTINRERLLYLGLTDSLTECYNRRYLENRLAAEIANAQRYGQPLSCLFIDIDHFKRINDTYDHATGDQVLREIARRTRNELRASDTAARYGGEEFVVLLPHTCGNEAVYQAERIRRAINSAPVAVKQGFGLKVTASIGVADIWPPSDEQPQTASARLLNAADNALYRAKGEGRDRVALAPGWRPR